MAPVYGGVVTIAVTVTPVPHDIYDFEWRWWQAPAVKTKLWTTEKEYLHQVLSGQCDRRRAV
jgi:hypothetical protein